MNNIIYNYLWINRKEGGGEQQWVTKPNGSRHFACTHITNLINIHITQSAQQLALTWQT